MKNEGKKYELTDETIKCEGRTLHRIKALRDVNDNVKAGDLGGWVESENNLSQDGKCWIYDEATVFDDARVEENAIIQGQASLFMQAIAKGNCRICGGAIVADAATVEGHATVYHQARVLGKSKISGHANIYQHAYITNDAVVEGSVAGHSEVLERAVIHAGAKIMHYALVDNAAEVHSGVTIRGCAEIHGNAVLKSNKDYIVFKNNFSSGRCFTWTRSNDMWRVGCFYGTADELLAKAKDDGKRVYEGYKAYVELVEKLKKVVADDENN